MQHAVNGLKGLLPKALLTRLTLAGAMLLGAAALAACGGGGASSSPSSESASSGGGTESGSAESGDGGAEEVKVGLFMLGANNAYVQQDLAGAKKAAEEDGNATVTGLDGKFEPEAQFKQIEDATAAHQFDVYVVMPNDGRSIASAVREAGAEGIKTVAAYGTIGPDPEEAEPQVEGVVGTVWTPTAYYGEKLGELTVEACKRAKADPCKVAYMNGGLSIPFEKERLPFYEKPLKESTDPRIELVAKPEGEISESGAITAAQDTLQADPDIDVFASIADQMTSGIEKVLKSTGKEGQITLVSVGGTKAGVKAVREHKWLATVPSLPFEEGYYATKMAIEAARGKDPAEPVVLLYEHSPIGGGILNWQTAKENPDFEGEYEG